MNQALDAVTMNLECHGALPLSLQVQSAQYQAKIQAPYVLQVTLQAPWIALALNTPCVLSVRSRRFADLQFAGVVAEVKDRVVTLLPAHPALFQGARSGIYYEASVAELIAQSLQAVSVESCFSQAYPVQKSLTQYAETDWQFVARQAAEYGIWMAYWQNFKTGGAAILRLGDCPQALLDRGPVAILDHAHSEGAGLFEVEWAATDDPEAVMALHFVEDDNAILQAGEGGIQHHSLGNQLSVSQLNEVCAVAQAGIQAQQQVLTAKFQGLDLQIGESIQLDLGEGLQAFAITAVHYDFAGQHQLTAAALFDFSGKTLTYRAPIWVKGVREHAPTVVQGILSGAYGRSEEAVVVPDALGNVPVYFPYDYAASGQTQAQSRWTRMASWSNQAGRTGKSFPVYADTELQIVFANGNMDYPIIKGTAANRETGHVHDSSIQRRTHWRLPQGQHLTYSNVPGDDNFIQLGALHQEGAQRSSLLLSNYRDIDQPGVKRLDYQQATTQSLEKVTGQNYHSLQAGALNVMDTAVKANPMTYLVIQLGDQTNITLPEKAPTLQEYLQSLVFDLSLVKQGQDAPLSYVGLSVNAAQKFSVQQVLEPNVNPQKISQYGALSVDISQPLEAQFILQNTQVMMPARMLTLPPAVWQKNKSIDAWGNVFYTVVLTLLAPPLICNFRQDVAQAQKQLSGADLTTYQILAPYFNPDADSLAAAQDMTPLLSEDQLNFFVHQGNNVTLFIHGYNVGFGRRAEPDDDLSASAAHQWFSQMEQNLNQAAGFDGWDYTKYTRLIGIAWQGDPISPVDFRADYAMTQFPSQRLLLLLQQLSQHGLEINLMGHSCGNQVLLQVLELAAASGIQVNHSFLWEPAVAENALDAVSTPLLAMEFQNAQGEYTVLPAPACFPNAAKASRQITVLYSQDDTILGSINAQPSQATWTAEAIHDFYIGLFGSGPVAQAVKGIGHAMVFSLESMINPVWALQRLEAKQAEDDPSVGNILHETKTDPGAGLFFAAPAEVMLLLDRYGMDHISRQLDLVSIYHLANLFVEPLGFFLAQTENIQHFYLRWRQQYQTFILPKQGQNQPTPFVSDLQIQQQVVSAALPEAYNLLSVGMYLMLYLKQGVTATLKEAIVLAIKECPAICDWKRSALPLFKADDALGQQAERLATLMLSVILTDGAKVPAAMGYRGVQGPYCSSPQQDPSGKNLCVDHSAMLLPTPAFMQYVYKGVLMQGASGFQYFGLWRQGA